MKKDYIDFQDRSVPIAYLITIRCYGTWLHGDKRGSMDRSRHNGYRMPKIAPNVAFEESDASYAKERPFVLDAPSRNLVKKAILEVCEFRGHRLYALNVRSNHVHVIVSSGRKVELIMHSIKAYSTRKLRESALANQNSRIWSRHGSTRYIWTDSQLERAIGYVLYEQGEELPEF